MLADEGSGSYIGKSIVKAYLLKQLPGELNKLFEEKFNTGFYTIMEKVYKKPFPNRYLASFCPFLSENIKHPYCRALVKRAFEDFFIAYIIKYKNHQKLPFNCVGSIGYYFKEILEEVCRQFGVQAVTIIKTPMDGLIKYHKGTSKNFRHQISNHK
jgi:N-acetylglucosamine kinase-like BadF-type ATPase